MMYEIYNPPKRLKTAELDSAVCFACDYLGLDKNFVIEFETLKKYHYGHCCNCDLDEEIVITISKRLSMKDIVRTLFHELVHVKQYLDGRLETGNPFRWHGIPTNCNYDNYPWEIEAFDLEEKMMKKFYSSNKSKSYG